MTRVSVLITAFREPETISQTLTAVLPQLGVGDECVVVCPDDETANAAQTYSQVTVRRDPGAGKPAALNVGLEQISNEIVVMTDGDVVPDRDALAHLMAPFADPQVGAVSGRPISTSPRDTMLGYWSHLLTDAGAHAERLKRDQQGQFFVCSGYLYGVRRALISPIPEDALAEDAVVSHMVGNKGYRICYAPQARVAVKYPDNYRDWLKQKVRSAGGYAQPVIAESPLRMRSFWHEAMAGTVRALRYPRSIRELVWTLVLFAARLHLWMLILWYVRVLKTPLTTLWKRVESTK